MLLKRREERLQKEKEEQEEKERQKQKQQEGKYDRRAQVFTRSESSDPTEESAKELQELIGFSSFGTKKKK